jgi:bifunctional UDP-N-acetylglucosamine pyrophosphorylase / glucosamine-1-phosphate N-acetyltransferase
MASKASATAPLSVLILAAGQGKRMNSDLPKVLQSLAGRALLWHVLDATAKIDAAAVHVIYGHGGEAVRDACRGAKVGWIHQAEQLGTGHAVQQAVPQLPDSHRVLILFGDVPLITPATLNALLAAAGSQAIGLLTAHFIPPGGYGRVVRGSRGQVLRIVEERDASARERKLTECNTGIMVLPAKALKGWLKQLKKANAQGEYYLTDIIALAVKDRVRITPLLATSSTEVLGVNDRLQLAALESAYRQQRAQELMLGGVTLTDPARIDIRGEVSFGRDVLIEPNVMLEGPVHLGDRVRIGPHCVLRAVDVGADTHIKSHSVLEQARIGQRCQIGPYARLRPGAQLHEDVHVGNFVEIKQSELGAGSKANHLSYLGDASIGAGVNVGAGTITCNYDGAHKWRTEIGDDAFIGSGTMLVAPVRVGKGATIGAGSTITSDAPAAQLTLERSRQVSIAHWERPTKRKPPKDSGK